MRHAHSFNRMGIEVGFARQYARVCWSLSVKIRILWAFINAHVRWVIGKLSVVTPIHASLGMSVSPLSIRTSTHALFWSILSKCCGWACYNASLMNFWSEKSWRTFVNTNIMSDVSMRITQSWTSLNTSSGQIISKTYIFINWANIRTDVNTNSCEVLCKIPERTLI